MRNDQVSQVVGGKLLPVACAVATLVGAIVWSTASLLVGLAVVSIAGSIGPASAAARERARAAALKLDAGSPTATS
jgi:hypothetical protein